jgi:hypothetical protein
MLKPHYVKCKISLGNFDGEFYVILEASSAFVSKESVRFKHAPETTGEVDGQVLAYLITEEKDKELVQLPGEPAVGGLRAWVSKSDLATA